MTRRDDGKRKVSIAVLPDTYNTIRMPLRPVGCWRLGDGVFRFDHKLIGREAKDEFDAFWAIRERFPRAPIALFGHADPSGDDAYNHTLAAERATAVYAVLNGDPDMWHDLFADDPDALASLKVMLRSYDVLDPDEKGFGPTTTEAVRAHFDYLGSGRRLVPFDYLEDGLAAIQSCSEFNPVVRIAVADVHRLVDGDHRRIHAANRRVLAYFFEPGTRVGDWWPCPVAGEGHDACPKRFWSDAEARRQPPASGFVQYWPQIARGEPEPPYEASEELFACRFYERLARATTCELVKPAKPRPPEEDDEKEDEDDDDIPPDDEPDDDEEPPIPPPDPGPSDWEMHLTCSHAPETERTNRFNLGYGSGQDIFEVVAYGGGDTVHVHSEPPHLPITWSTKSDASPSGSTTFDVEAPKLAKVSLMSVYRAKPRKYEIRGVHLGKEQECIVRAYPPDEWKLDFEKIRKPVRDLLGPALFAWNEVVELLVPGVDDLKVRFLEEDEASGLMRVAWEEAPFPTGEGGLADYRAFPHFVFSMRGEPLILAGGTLELSIGSLLKAKKFKHLYDKIPQKIRRVLDAFTATGAVEVSFGGTQTIVVDSPDRSLSIGTPSSSSTMEFEGAFSDGLDISVEDEESGLEASGSLKIVASPTLGVIFDPDAERFGFYLKGSFGPVTGNFTLALPGVDFETGEFEIFGERSVSRREVEFSAEFFKERFGG